ncbi:MAG TPA: hypothetical protein VNM90_07155 [Haliangium sp.]|nr:hypothetical protein [Haliangium sp.]
MTESTHGSSGQGARTAGSAPRHLAALGYARALAAAVGRPALARGVPLYLGLLLPAGVIFGPNGMHPADLADAADASAGVRLVLWSGWTLAALPVAHALFDGESSAYLRWLPAPRWWTLALLVVMLVVVQAVFALFWWAARGPVDACAAVALAAAVQAAILVAPRGRLEALARALALAGGVALVLAGLRSEVLLGAGLAGLAVAVPAAWARCVEHGARRASALRGSRPALVLAQLYLRGLWRTRPGLVTRTLLTTALGAGLVVLSSAANELDLADRAGFSAMVAAVSLSLAAGGLAVPVLEAERGLRWILDSTGTRAQVRVAARSLAAAVAGGAFGATHGALASWGAGWPGLVRLGGVAALLGAGLGVLAVRSAVWAEAVARDRAVRRRRAETPDLGEGVEIDGARVIASVAGAMIVALVALHVLGEPAALVVPCAGLIVAGGKSGGRR